MNMKRLLSLVAIFATLQASAQQVNPVPDYVFANRMSAGRNTVTDTAAYFSIGPRYGATRGMMPPMVVDTASFSGNKRNGLLIFSVQKNKFLYWDSVGVKWAEMAGTGGTAISSGDTASMLLPYVRHAGYGLTKSGQSFLVDTLNISTRAWRQKGLDSLAALEVSGSGTTNYVPKFTAASTIGNSIAYDNGTEFLINTTTDNGNYTLQNNGAFYSAGSAMLSMAATDGATGMVLRTSNSLNSNTAIRWQNSANTYTVGIATYFNVADAGLEFLTSGTTARMNIRSNGNVLIGTTVDSSYRLFVAGTARTTELTVNTSGSPYTISTFAATSTDGQNIWIGGGGLSSVFSSASTDGSYNVAVGRRSMLNNTSGYFNAALGIRALSDNTTGYQNTSLGHMSMRFSTTAYANSFVGASSGYNLSTGYQNSGLGVSSLYDITTGFRNVGIGFEAGQLTSGGAQNQTSNTSIYIGYDSRPSASGNTNEIVIGSTSRGNGSNTVTIGNSSISQNYFSGAINTSAPSGGTLKPWKLGEAATVSPTSPNRTIRVEIDGTVYYLHAKTTND